ncbi:hypothetical protein LTR91_002618 [Friedmanniomyces endolithicus]|uniref:Uncharacterized protein n=1 Tax=Friedmanniomyces endolithicus TaxID=329885 RepID=A0AAN6KYL6_9PEZI|nr:hypothetical protein LTR82_006300 [Friedmanniomyces endolithicus]KAK0963429.1 hypothetical protein LTS01_019307 [Friedmanniomyces endolithicus]KAK1010222.1 hypothetical protein LTR91_002618 [Friedmanniomyces endolithicus]KAK1047882.1 hypothetical protein LTS16_004728 [Friedmanniomyces endolithicus]
MVTKIELRVHAGAPSDRQSDNRCQTLAAAYLGFTGRVVLHGTGSAQGAAEDASHVLMSDQLLDEVIDGSDPIVLYDESTYVEDTQLAYDALESQLETSSLDVPEATPLKRALPADFDDASQWPEDLDRQSPRIARASLTHDQPSLHHDGSPASGDEGSPVNTQPSKPALHDPGKRPCLQRRAPATSIFKPFQPPLKSGPPDQGRDITPETRTLAPRVGRRSGSGSDLALSQSSYLMTPVLITPTQGAQASSGKQNAVTLQARQAIKQNHRDGADDPRGHRAAEASMLPDYRERTPLHKPHLPYKDLPEGDRAGLAFIGDQHEAQPLHEPTAVQRQSQLSGRTPETTSELPTSYSLSEITSQSSRARLRDSQRSTSDPGPLGYGGVGDSAEKSARSSSQRGRPTREAAQPEAAGKLIRTLLVDEPRPAVGQGTHEPHVKGTAAPSAVERTPKRVPVASSLPDVPKAAESDRSLPIREHLAVSSFEHVLLTIHPPEPAVSLDSFVTHVTPALAWLAGEQSVVRDCYHPVSVSRPMRPLERGYWLVNPSTWTQEVQHKFWKFLESQVGSGDVGWGVWCLREPGQSVLTLPGQGEGGLGLVKVFCWGEVVKHIYLMLYVASNSRVRKIGLQWVDAEEVAVVQMRSSGT